MSAHDVSVVMVAFYHPARGECCGYMYCGETYSILVIMYYTLMSTTSRISMLTIDNSQTNEQDLDCKPLRNAANA